MFGLQCHLVVSEGHSLPQCILTFEAVFLFCFCDHNSPCVCMRAQLCQTLCDSLDCSSPGSSVMRFPRQEYRSGLPFPSLGDLPNPGTEPLSPVWQADSLPLSHQGSPHTVNPFQTQHRNTLKVQSASPDFPVHQAFPTPAS